MRIESDQAPTRGRSMRCSRFRRCSTAWSRCRTKPTASGGSCLLEDVIGPRLDALFGGYRTTERVAFRVTRNSDLTIQENEVKSSLLSTIEETLRQRKWGAAVRLEISERADEGSSGAAAPASALELDDRDVYKVPGPVDLTALRRLCKIEGFRELKEPPFEPQMPARSGQAARASSPRSATTTCWSTIPTSRSASVVQFIEQASEDPRSWRSS